MTTTTARELVNPYWDEVRAIAEPSEWQYDHGAVMVKPYRFPAEGGVDVLANRDELCSRYSWTIPDPATVAFIAEHACGSVVDPLAGSGYLLWLLQQAGVDVIGYDANPPASGGNNYHKAQVEHLPIQRADACDSVTLHPDRTLLLSWPPYDSPIGAQVLNAYAGDRVIYIGEGEGGCCGDDAMHHALAEQWTEVAEHRPVQWYGIHDWVTVYDRKAA